MKNNVSLNILYLLMYGVLKNAPLTNYINHILKFNLLTRGIIKFNS